MLQVTGKLLRVADFATEGMWYASHRYRGLNTLESMTFQSLSSNSQDYLKVIWDLQEWTHEPIQPAAIAKRTGMKPSTVSGALGRLVSSGLVQHAPYGAVTLTDRGERYALKMVRRHRLLELFLVDALGYRWDEVHDEADSLEHAVSDMMITRIDAALGHPSKDPHGDPIPSEAGDIPEVSSGLLSEATPGSIVRIERVNDEDPELLRYLEDEGFGIGKEVRIKSLARYADSVSFSLVGGLEESAPIALGLQAARQIRVVPVAQQASA
jgi:DtxR family Mn-dependent transcriptional regulator